MKYLVILHHDGEPEQYYGAYNHAVAKEVHTVIPFESQRRREGFRRSLDREWSKRETDLNRRGQSIGGWSVRIMELEDPIWEAIMSSH